jgi:hypothetical protein
MDRTLSGVWCAGWRARERRTVMSVRANLDAWRAHPPLVVAALVAGAALLACAPGGTESHRGTDRTGRPLTLNETFPTQTLGFESGDMFADVQPGIIYAFRGLFDGTFVTQIQFAYYIPREPTVTNVYRDGDFFGAFPAKGANQGTESGWITCPADQAAFGFFGTYGGGDGAAVNQFKLACGTVVGLEVPPFSSITAAIGQPIGIPFNAGSCEADGFRDPGYLSGVITWSDNFLNGLSGICRDAGR